MATVVRMPSVLAGATEAAIAHWLVAPGDTVAVGTPIAEIETEKALVEYAAEEAGVVGRLVLGEGDTGEIGDPIAVLVAAGETDADIDAALGGRAARRRRAPPRPGRRCAAAAPAGARAGRRTGTRLPANGGRIFASPLVRKLAASGASTSPGWPGPGRTGGSCGATWNGSWPRARRARGPRPACGASGARAVRPAPGQRQAARRSPPRSGDCPLPVAGRWRRPAPAGGTLIPHTPMRRAIARRLTESKATVPHFYLTAERVGRRAAGAAQAGQRGVPAGR